MQNWIMFMITLIPNSQFRIPNYHAAICAYTPAFLFLYTSAIPFTR